MIARPLIKIPDNVKITDVLFLSELDVTPIRTEGYWLLFRKTIWRLNKDFTFVVYARAGEKFYKYEIIIKAGFEYDFASIPKPLWWLYDPYDCRYNKSATGHDIIYAAEIFPKWFNDDFLSAGMQDATRLNKFNFHAAVKTFGWMTYRTHTEKTIEVARQLLDLKEFIA